MLLSQIKKRYQIYFKVLIINFNLTERNNKMKTITLMWLVIMSGCTISGSIDWIPQNKEVIITEKQHSEKHEDRGFFSKFFR